MMPADLIAECDRQRKEAVESLKQKQRLLILTDAPDWTFMFDESGPLFERAVHVIVELHPRGICTRANVERVTFTPVPTKYEGAWRIFVSFRSDGPCAATEWHVHEDQLWAAWERSREENET